MSHSSVHFIHTIIGGLVEIIPNTGPCGRSAFRFKGIGAIYSPEVANSIKMPRIVARRVTRRSQRKLDFDGGGSINEDVSGCAENQIDNKCSIDSDEDSISEITLQELKERCKAKKRKVSKAIDLTEQDVDFSRKSGPTNVQIKEEVSDLEETLSSWKQRLSKKPKVKRKHQGKHSCSRESAGSVKDEEKSSSCSDVSEDFRGKESSKTGESCILYKIKSEIIEIDSSDHQNAVCADDCPATACSMEADISDKSDKSSPELLDRVGGGDMATRNPISCSVKVEPGDSPAVLSERIEIELDKGELTTCVPQFEDCCINKVSTQYMEPAEPVDILGGPPKMNFLEDSHSPSTSVIKLETALTGPLYSGNTEALSVPKDVDSEVHGFCQNNSSNEKHFYTVTELPDLANDNLWCAELDDERSISAFESEGPEKLVDEVPKELDKSSGGSRENAYDPANHSTICGSHSSLEEISCQMDDKMCDMDIDQSFQCTGLYNENDRCTSDLESKGLDVLDEVPMDRVVPNKEDNVPVVCKEDSVPCHENKSETIGSLYTPSRDFDLCYSLAGNFHSCNDSVPRSEKMFSSSNNETVLATAEVTTDSFTEAFVSNPANELTETDLCSLEPARPPEKLLSTRKVISPMSQEKLCRAAENDELCDEIKISKNGKNPGLEKCTMNKVSSQACFEEAEFIIKKLKIRKSGSPPSVMNSNVKGSQVSCSMSCACPQCTWISEHSQKAITFSQRQMHDIESLASRLLNGLRSMKDIIEDTLLSEACLSLPFKYSVDEIKEATMEMNVLEDSTRKWLSMMTKDCNRFCKIMTSTTDKAASKVSAVHKVPKKVTFADEVGGTLCHVKILEGHSTFM